MTSKTITECSLILNGTELTADMAEQIAEANNLLSDTEETGIFLKNDVIAAIDDKVERVRRKAYDAFIVKTQASKYLDGNVNYSEALKKMATDIYGRNSMDTERRFQRNTLLNALDRFSKLFGVPEELNIRKIEEGSEQEKKLFAFIESMEDDIDVNTLTPQKARELVKDLEDPLQKLAYAIHSYNSYTRDFLQNNGIPLTRTKGYVINRRYDSAALENTTAEAFANDFKDMLDWDATLGRKGVTEDEMETYLKNTYNKMKENNEIREYSQGTIDMDIKESKWKAKRDFVFKDSEASYKAFNEYSVGSLGAQIENSAWAMSSEAVKISRLGYDPTKNVADIRKRLIADTEKSTGISQKIDKTWDAYRFNRITQATMDIAGTNNYAAGAATTMSTFFKTVTAVGKLGNAITVAMLDPLDVMRQVYYVNGSTSEALGAWGQWHANMFRVVKETGIREVLKGDLQGLNELGAHLGLVTSFISSESSMRVARGELSTSTSTVGKAIDKYGNTAMKVATFLPQQTAMSKISTAMVGARQFTKLLDKVSPDGLDISKLNKWELDTLKEYKIGAKDIELLKKVDRIKTWGDSEILSGKNIRDYFMFPADDIPYEDHLARMSKEMGVAPEQVGEAAIILANKYDAFANDFVTRGTPTPELSTKTALGKATDKEAINVVTGLIFQFMDTPIAQLQAFSELIEKSGRIHEGDSVSKKKWLALVGADVAKQAVPHAIIGMGMFMAYDAIWSAVAGKESYVEKFAKGDDTTKNEIALDILGRTSVVPFLFEAINNGTSRYYGGGIADTVGGPSIDLINQLQLTANPNNEQETFMKLMQRQIPNALPIQMIRNRME